MLPANNNSKMGIPNDSGEASRKRTSNNHNSNTASDEYASNMAVMQLSRPASKRMKTEKPPSSPSNNTGLAASNQFPSSNSDGSGTGELQCCVAFVKILVNVNSF